MHELEIVRFTEILLDIKIRFDLLRLLKHADVI